MGCSIVEVVGRAGSRGVGFWIEGGLGGSRFSEGFTGVLMGTCRVFTAFWEGVQNPKKSIMLI